MISLRLKLFLMSCLFLLPALGLSFTAFKAFQEFRNHRRQLEISHYLRSELANYADLKPDSEPVKRASEYLVKIESSPRADSISKIIRQSLDGGPRPTRQEHTVFLKNESEFQRYTREQLDYLENKWFYFTNLAIGTLVAGMLMIFLFVCRSVVSPINRLSRYMVDFMNDRYTYQFTVPGFDEIGRMHTTFNSLAQRVISNMEQLRTLDQAKSEFLSIASHELRTPLTSIKGSISLMRSGVVGPMNEMAENLLKIAETETDRLIRLINDILDLTKIEAQKLELHQSWQSLNAVIEVSLESLNGLAQQAEVQLVAEALPPLEAHIDGDRIQQVLTNLLSNAIKFSPRGKIVAIRSTVNDRQQLMIEVCDQGRGIAPQDQEAIFQKFRQATNEKNPLVKGTGLGLAIAKALVDQHGGEIGVRSLPGQGSTFYFSLPEWRYQKEKGDEVAA